MRPRLRWTFDRASTLRHAFTVFATHQAALLFDTHQLQIDGEEFSYTYPMTGSPDEHYLAAAEPAIQHFARTRLAQLRATRPFKVCEANELGRRKEIYNLESVIRAINPSIQEDAYYYDRVARTVSPLPVFATT